MANVLDALFEILYDDDTYFCNNVSLVVLSIVIYLLFLLFRLLTRCFSAHAKHVVQKEKDGGTSYEKRPTKSPPSGEFTDEQIIYDYLYRTYWFKKYPEKNPRKRKITEKDFRPALRHYDTDRDIQIVYSRQTVWRLAFSEKLELGAKENFAYVFKGLKSWSSEETQGRFANVTADLLQFRQVISYVTGRIISYVTGRIISLRRVLKIFILFVLKMALYTYRSMVFFSFNFSKLI